MRHIKVTYRIDSVTGDRWHAKCRHGSCGWACHSSSETDAWRNASRHAGYHASRWAA